MKVKMKEKNRMKVKLKIPGQCFIKKKKKKKRRKIATWYKQIIWCGSKRN